MTELKKKLVNFPINRPKLSLFLAFIIISIFIPFGLSPKFDFGARVWFRATDPYIVALDQFEKNFGNDESIVLAIQTDTDVFNKDFLKKVHEMTEELWLVPKVQRVESLTNYFWSYSEDDDMITEEFLPVGTLDDQEFLLSRREIAKNHKVIPFQFISKDFKSVALYARLAHIPGKDTDFDLIHNSLIERFKKFEGDSSFKIHYLGQPTLSSTFQYLSFLDLRVMTPILLLLVIIYLVYCFRTINGIVIPMGIIFCSLCVTFGLLGIFNMEINTLTFILPSILIAISIADSVHILSSYYDYRSKEVELHQAVKFALMKNLWPIFLTTVSTAIGFFSLTSSDIVPVHDVGLLAGLGTISALIFSYLIVGPILILHPDHGGNSVLNKSVMSRENISAFVDLIDRHKGKIIIFSTIFSLTSVYLALQNEINSNPYNYFTEDQQISKSNQFVLSNFGGVGGPELVFDSSKAEGVKNPGFLKSIDNYQEWVQTQPEVNKGLSLTDVLKEVNKSLFGGDESEYRINDSRETIAEELFLYTMSLPQGMDINNRVDLKNRLLRVSLLWDIQNSKESLEKVRVLELEAKKRGLDMQVTGKPILFHRMNSYVVYTFFTSMGMALLFITIMLIFIFNSLPLGMLSLIPNFVPIIIGAGVLYLLGKPIDVGCAIVASVTLGIAVDDTIHFLSHYSSLRSKGHDMKLALIEVFETTGLALVITTVILVSCFGLFMLAHLVPNINFGILCSLVLSFALFCDLILLPALILCFGQRKSAA